MALSEKTKRWLSKNRISSLEGRRVLITGATGGVGLKSAEIMIYLNARVIMACRNLKKAEAVKERFLKEYPSAEIEIIELDLADFKSIDRFVSEIAERNIDIGVFLNNAGVFRKPGMLTADGFDAVLGTNYLGVYYLTEKILPYLETLPHDVLCINTVSLIHKFANENYKDCFSGKRRGDFSVYACSKLCLAKYTYYLSQRCKGTNIKVLMNHPGISATPLAFNSFGKTVRSLGKVFGGIFNSPEKSALALPLIMSKDFPAGSITGPARLFGGWGYPKENRVGRKVKTAGKELTDFTKETVKDALR